MALNIDIPATILDLAGISKPEIYQGESLVKLVNTGKSNNWRESFLCEHRMNNEIIPKYVGIRGERYVYAKYYEQEPVYEFLHDLKKDPEQLVNLVDDPNYDKILNQIRETCDITEKGLK